MIIVGVGVFLTAKIRPFTDHPHQGQILTSFCPFLLQGADNKGGFGLISAFFMLQGAEDVSPPFLRKMGGKLLLSAWAEGGRRGADFSLGPS